jgi:3-oxoacyl-[acyl-carrier-protein] synthase II
MRRSVAITGIGPVTAFGIGIEPLWSAMVAGRSAIGRVERFATAGFPCPFAAELASEALDIRAIVPKSYRKATKVMCRDIQLAVAAAGAAVADAGLRTRGTDPEAEPTVAPARMGCHIGAGLISAEVEELTGALHGSRRQECDPDGAPGFDLARWGAVGMNDLTPLWLLKYLPNMLACHVTIIHDCQGPSNTITCCEASSALSLGESMRVIERGAAECCLTGGAEDKLNPMAFMRQYFAGRLADAGPDQEPASIVRPFDDAARGTVVGEGGGILVLEALEAAQRRGARIYATVSGFAARQSACADAAGLAPAPGDESLADALRGALDEAGVDRAEVDAIAPFGSSIPHVDEAEASAIRAVLGARAATVPVITTIPNVGNCNAGNTAVALSVAARALREQRLPARLGGAGSSRGLNAGAAPSTAAPLRNVLVFTMSQGGQNAAAVLSRTGN